MRLMRTTQEPPFGVSEFTTWPWKFEQDVEHYARLSVDTIEVCEFKLDPQRAAEQLALIKSSGLTISSVQPRVHALYPDSMNPAPKQPADRVPLYRQTIELFGKAAPGVTLVAITGAAPAGNYREAFEVAAREYRLLADYAADHGVRIGLEPLNPNLMNTDTILCTLPDAIRLVEEVNRPSFGVFLDVWHVWQDPLVHEHIRACGDRIFGVHINDWHMPRSFGDRAIIGQGEMDLPPLLQTIAETGYDGAYMLELFSTLDLPDSLWKGDMSSVITKSRDGFQNAWQKAFPEGNLTHG